MPRIWIENELSIRNFLGERERIDGWNHDVAMAVHDERRLSNGLKFLEALPARLTPFRDSRPLPRHRLRRRGYVYVFLSGVPSRPKHFSCCLARPRCAKKHIEGCLDGAF